MRITTVTLRDDREKCPNLYTKEYSMMTPEFLHSISGLIATSNDFDVIKECARSLSDAVNREELIQANEERISYAISVIKNYIPSGTSFAVRRFAWDVGLSVQVISAACRRLCTMGILKDEGIREIAYDFDDYTTRRAHVYTRI